MRHWALMALGCAVVCLANADSDAADRVALVIGNSKYAGELALQNPTNDADALEGALKELGFTVLKQKDLNLTQMQDAMVEFRRALPKGGLGLFYYAGHGLQVQGENFLVPVGARIREEFEVKRQCLEVGQVLDAMGESESNLKVVILDCCRDNPLKRGWKRRGVGEHGLAAIGNIPEGTVIAYSTTPGKTADDGKGKNSPYAEHLVAALRSRPAGGLEIRDVFFEASRGVKKATGQVPWLNMEASLEKYYLRPAGTDGSLASKNSKAGLTETTRPTRREELKSGPALGEDLQTFNVRDITGRSKGKTLSYIAEYGVDPVVCVFCRSISSELTPLVKALEKAAARNKQLRVLVVFLTENPDRDEPQLEKVARDNSLYNVPLTVVEGITGPPFYRLSKDAEITVLMWRWQDNWIVKVNHAYRKGELDESEIEKLVSETSRILD